MTEVTDADREKAHGCLFPGTFADRVELIAAALAEERERERLAWNPMVGRGIQVAQEWARTPLPIWTDKAAERINRAIEGDQ